MTEIKPQNVTKGMRIRIIDEDGCWSEGIAETGMHTRGYSRNKVLCLRVDLMKIYSDDSPAEHVEPKNSWVGIHCKCFLVD